MVWTFTVGAGGGSIARAHSGGLLEVPAQRRCRSELACYRRGNIDLTIANANIVLGTLNPSHLLGRRSQPGGLPASSTLPDGDRRGHRVGGDRAQSA